MRNDFGLNRITDLLETWGTCSRPWSLLCCSHQIRSYDFLLVERAKMNLVLVRVPPLLLGSKYLSNDNAFSYSPSSIPTVGILRGYLLPKTIKILNPSHYLMILFRQFCSDCRADIVSSSSRKTYCNDITSVGKSSHDAVFAITQSHVGAHHRKNTIISDDILKSSQKSGSQWRHFKAI